MRLYSLIFLLIVGSSVHSKDLISRCDKSFNSEYVAEYYAIGFTQEYILEMYADNDVSKVLLLKRNLATKTIPFDSCKDLQVVDQIDISKYLDPENVGFSLACQDVESPLEFGYKVIALVPRGYGMSQAIKKAWEVNVSGEGVMGFHEIPSARFPLVYCMTLPGIDFDHDSFEQD